MSRGGRAFRGEGHSRSAAAAAIVALRPLSPPPPPALPPPPPTPPVKWRRGRGEPGRRRGKEGTGWSESADPPRHCSNVAAVAAAAEIAVPLLTRQRWKRWKRSQFGRLLVLLIYIIGSSVDFQLCRLAASQPRRLVLFQELCHVQKLIVRPVSWEMQGLMPKSAVNSNWADIQQHQSQWSNHSSWLTP